MLIKTLRIAINYHHICNPLSIHTEEKKLSCQEKVIGVALLIFGSLVTCGGFAVFIFCTAFRKQKKIQVMQLKIEQEKKLQKEQGRLLPEGKDQILQTESPSIISVQQPIHQALPIVQDLESYERDYNIDEIIARIKTLGMEVSNQGKKLGLFIGRTAKEALPSEEEEQDMIWASLDVEMGSIPLEGRIHLKMDCNDESSMKKISHLFDKVVLDLSVLKFLHEDPWRRLGKLLKKEKEATLITEATGKISIGNKNDKSYEGAVCFTLEEYKQSELKIQILQKANFESEKYLKTIFEDVKLVEGENYPYKNEINHSYPYFILKDPKYPELTYSKLQHDAIMKKKLKSS